MPVKSSIVVFVILSVMALFFFGGWAILERAEERMTILAENDKIIAFKENQSLAFFVEGPREEIDMEVLLYRLDPDQNTIFVVGRIPGPSGRDQYVPYWYQFSTDEGSTCTATQLDQTLSSAKDFGALITFSYRGYAPPMLEIYEGLGSASPSTLWSADECHGLAE